MNKQFSRPRRTFVTGVVAGGTLLGLGVLPRLAMARNHKEAAEPPVLTGNEFDLTIGEQKVNFTGRRRIATTVNGSLPAPTLRFKEGESVTLRVKNTLAEQSSIHWHGMILPTEMDGVPDLSFAGIDPGETYEYRFKVKQSGTYWYHSHSGFQEQTGLYGAIVIDPVRPDPVEYDREHVIMLSDWTDEDPHSVYRKLKTMSHYYNTRERTLGDLYSDIKTKGIAQTWRERSMWNEMRMSDRDISDVTGYTYTFLMNGQVPAEGFTALFKPGEKVRLRFINAAAMTYFDVRIPGLKMTVVAADGQDVDPISIDEFRIGVAETYDVIVEPEEEKAYCLFAQAIDRSGYAVGYLTPRARLKAEIPAMDPAPILTHRDMGMSHAAMGHDMASMETNGDVKVMDHSMHHGHHKMAENKPAYGTGQAGLGSNQAIEHVESEYGPQVDMRAEVPQYALDDPGIGLRDHREKYGRRVLTYTDLKNRYPTRDKRQPSREIQLHLTGNMNRYMWSINGIPFADAEPLQLQYGERVRITLVNDTMMTHPIHLHGMWSELETGDPDHIPRKHTINVQPGAKVSYLVTADAEGRWAYHCHLMYHMLGMFREVRVV